MGNDRHDHDDIVKAIKAMSINNGKWLALINTTLTQGLAAIALACSTSEDNSAEIKTLTEKLKSSTDSLKAAVDAHQ
jgi:hypothetical protein